MVYVVVGFYSDDIFDMVAIYRTLHTHAYIYKLG